MKATNEIKRKLHYRYRPSRPHLLQRFEVVLRTVVVDDHPSVDVADLLWRYGGVMMALAGHDGVEEAVTECAILSQQYQKADRHVAVH